MGINLTNASLLVRIIATHKLRGIRYEVIQRESFVIVHPLARDRSPHLVVFRTEARRSYCSDEALRLEIEM